jgi:hypothetical protein
VNDELEEMCKEAVVSAIPAYRINFIFRIM